MVKLHPTLICFNIYRGKKVKKYIVINVLISAAIQLFLFFFIQFNNFDYLYDPNPVQSNSNLFLNPDAGHYYLMAKNLLDHGVFSRSPVNPEQHPDLHRTPTYPIFLALLRLLSSKLFIIYIAHVILYILSIIMIMQMTNILTASKTAAFIAGLMMSLNISAYAYVFMSMAEIFFNFLTVASMYFFVLFVKKYKTGTFSSLVSIIFLTSMFTAINVLARPATKLHIFLFIVVGILFLRESLRKKLIYSCLFLVFYLIFVTPWLIRNKEVFGRFEFSNSQSINLIFWAGSSAFAMKHGLDVYDAQNLVSQEYNIPTYEQALNPWSYGQDPSTNEEKMKSVLSKILYKYPDKVVLGALIGFCKSHLSHNTDLFAEQFGMQWIPPTLSNLYKGKIGLFFDNLSQNHAVLIFLFVYQLLYFGALYGLLAVGAVVIVMNFARNTREIKGLYIMLFLTLMYFYMMIAVVNLYSYARHRMMAELIYFIVAGHAVLFLNRIRQNSAEIDTAVNRK
jgi:hypothetical protein